MVNKTEEIKLKIAKLEEQKKQLIEKKRKLIEEERKLTKEKLVTINLKFCTTIKDPMELLSRIKLAINLGFDLKGICPPSEIEVKKINIKE